MLIVLSPERVIADTVRNNESVKETLLEEPQNMTAEPRHTAKKYA